MACRDSRFWPCFAWSAKSTKAATKGRKWLKEPRAAAAAERRDR